MDKEATLEQIFSDIILFFDRNNRLIFLFTGLSILFVVLFQKFKPAYYSTSAIVTSGISSYERIPEDEDILNQRTAINLINNLQIDIDKEDYESLKEKLDLSSIDIASQIKFIEAEPLLRQDKDEKFHNTPKFQINLLVRDSEIIMNIEEGLLYYFNTNPYILKYQSYYNESNELMINAINLEINDLKDLRSEDESNIDMSTFRIFSSKDNTQIQNPIIDLEYKKVLIKTQDLIAPLDIIKGFTKTTVAEREVLVWGTTVGILSFLFSIFLALIREVKLKAKKQ